LKKIETPLKLNFLKDLLKQTSKLSSEVFIENSIYADLLELVLESFSSSTAPLLESTSEPAKLFFQLLDTNTSSNLFFPSLSF